MSETPTTTSVEQLQAEITALRAENETLRQKLIFDPATGLYRNEDLGREELIKKIDGAISAGQEITLAVIDLKKLREINNNHGHAAGDQAINTLAGWIKEFAGENGAGIRSHARGDEFGIMCIGENPNVIEAQVKKSQASGIPWQLGPLKGKVSFTLGMANLEAPNAAGKNAGEVLQSLWAAASAKERGDHQQANG